MRRLNDRLAKLETAAGRITGKLHMFFAWESWDRERVLDDYGRDKIADGDMVQFLVWRDSHLEEPMPYPRNLEGKPTR